MARKLDGGESAEPLANSIDDGEGGSDSTPLLGRREYVQIGVAAVAGMAGITGASGSVLAEAERADIRFDRVLDAVDDLGMDPTGGTSVASQLRTVPSDTLVQFPDGSYLIDERVPLSVAGSLGFEAVGDAILQPASALSGRALDVEEAAAVYYAGFSHDQSEGNIRHRLGTSDRFVVRDVDVQETELTGGETTSLSLSTAESYETIVLDPGEQRTHTLGDGDRFENVLIDQTAEGAMFTILTAEDADEWTIKNVGWRGRAPVDSGDRDHTFLINVRGNGHIENIFIDQRGDGDGTRGSGVGAIWTYSDSHHGHIECLHNYIAGCGNNGCYDSGDGWSHYPGSGTVAHDRCYHRDNTPSNFRPGKSGSLIRNCVSVANDPAGLRGAYPGNDSKLTRACWAWHNPDIRMENCSIWWDPDDVQPSTPFWATHRSGSEGDSCSLHVVDSDINASWESAGHDLGYGDVVFDNLGHDPSVDVLGEGVPLSPEMAARGERALPSELGDGESDPEPIEPSEPWSYGGAGDVHTDLPSELVIEHTTPGARVTYEIDFDGDVEVGEWDYNATVDGDVATGALGPDHGLDNIYFDGTITRIDMENAAHATCYLADAQERTIIEELDPGDYAGEEDGDGSDDEEPSVSTYEDAEGVHSEYPREFVIELDDPGEAVTYELEIDGDIEQGEIEDPAQIDGSVATGQVGPETGLDNVYFDGEITRFEGEHLERARILIADAQTRTILREFDPTTFPAEANPFSYAFARGDHTNLPKELVVEHVDPGERVLYELEVTGDLTAGEFEYPAQVDGTVASGALGPERGLDNLYFDGEITRFEGEHLEHTRIYLADAATRTLVQELDPADLPTEESSRSSITVIGTSEASNYELTVSGELLDDPATDFDTSDNISGGNAEGTVTDETHGYLFDGELTDIRVDGDASVLLDGDPVDPGDVALTNLIFIDGSVGADVTRYRFEVTGQVEYSADESSGSWGEWDQLDDHVAEDAVTGIVHDRIDAYRFSGAISDLEVTGSAEVTFELAD